MILVTGGAGFIGANFVLDWLDGVDEGVINVDKLTYAGNLGTLKSLHGDPSHIFVRGDICDRSTLDLLLARHQPRAIVHFAAESHVDRSIHGPSDFVQTNIVGTFTLLEAARFYWNALPADERDAFRFVNVSTDEVFGSLEQSDAPFSETSLYTPNSPFSATKASSDHLVRAWHHTYGLPTLTTHCSNNYGPYQFPEKLIPLMIINALANRQLPVYGDGQHVRDWLYVGDHCSAIRKVLAKGRPGESYNIGGCNEVKNIEVVHMLCDLLDDIRPKRKGSYRDQVTWVTERLGHDRRYAIDARKLGRELGWKPDETFESGLEKTVKWYLEHEQWADETTSDEFQDWLQINCQKRA
ncbi:dTDP-glucose 4,6-dehydratase [Paraburkholderia sp. IMGN_8]|uniref:dTDP-glucose 4,6-dehydratase n=1 Tax=Paraburkholderia sp. IMGN_8 TaxID=3136564 RepID=UPI0031016650